LRCFVKPGTVERWHRIGLSGLWRRHSKKRRGGRPRIATQIRDLIHRMAHDNFTRGAPRVHGERLKLGFTVSERTVSRYMPQRPRRRLHRTVLHLAGHRSYYPSR